MGTIVVNWMESHLMTGADSRGQTIVIGTSKEREPDWVGMKPSDLLLLSAASCSTYDVAMILNKQKQPIHGLEVHCTGDQMPEPPYAFTKIHLHYVVKGECNPEKVARAIQLSEEKYCSVLNTLRGSVALSSDFELV